MSTPGPALDRARRLVVERNLVAAAFGHLTDAFMALPFEALGPTKALLKRFFSSEDWGATEEDALAAAVGRGDGAWQRPLDTDLTLDFGWEGGRFFVGLAAAGPAEEPSRPALAADDPLASTFDGPVVPEATPNPRTIRFHVGSMHDGPSRWYESAPTGDADPGVARLFADFAEVGNVLVGPDFVAVSVRRPSDWERLLYPVLAAVTEEFAARAAGGEPGAPRVTGGPAGAGAGRPGVPSPKVRLNRLERAWGELGSLRPAEPADFALLDAATTDGDPFRRQVAANLLREADAARAATAWARLVGDPARSVRRATVDAIVDVGREELRSLLEGALADTDAWVRWKALRGLVELGAGPSRSAISGHAGDPDFRVRLEAAAALRAGG